MFGDPDEVDMPSYPVFSKVIGTFFILAVIAFSFMIFIVFSELYGRTKFLGEGSLFHDYQAFAAGLIRLHLREQCLERGALTGNGGIVAHGRRELLGQLCRSRSPTSATTLARSVNTLSHFGTWKEANEVLSPPLMDLKAIVALKEVVEYADRRWASAIADLMGDLQVVHSRAKNVRNHLMHAPSFARFADTLLQDAAALENKASGLFKYARQETEEPETARPINMRSSRAKAHFA